MSKNDFKIVIKSTDSAFGTLNADKTYYCDFSRFKDGYYRLTFSFVAGPNDCDPSEPANLLIDFGSTTTFKTDKYYSSFQTSNHIGLLFPKSLSVTSGHLEATVQENGATTLRLPKSGTFNVRITDIYGVFYLDNSVTPADVADYLLILNFAFIEE
jgi:hypothetical protein